MTRQEHIEAVAQHIYAAIKTYNGIDHPGRIHRQLCDIYRRIATAQAMESKHREASIMQTENNGRKTG